MSLRSVYLPASGGYLHQLTQQLIDFASVLDQVNAAHFPTARKVADTIRGIAQYQNAVADVTDRIDGALENRAHQVRVHESQLIALMKHNQQLEDMFVLFLRMLGVDASFITLGELVADFKKIERPEDIAPGLENLQSGLSVIVAKLKAARDAVDGTGTKT